MAGNSQRRFIPQMFSALLAVFLFSGLLFALCSFGCSLFYRSIGFTKSRRVAWVFSWEIFHVSLCFKAKKNLQRCGDAFFYKNIKEAKELLP